MADMFFNTCKLCSTIMEVILIIVIKVLDAEWTGPTNGLAWIHLFAAETQYTRGEFWQIT